MNYEKHRKKIEFLKNDEVEKSEKEFNQTQLFYEQMEEVYQEILHLQQSMVDESVRDSKQIFEKNYPESKLKEMYQHLDVTERMIFLSFVESKEFKTRKAFQKEYFKAMIIRKDEFYNRCGVTVEYIEGYRRILSE
jgi:hypothetical protein